MKFRDIKKFPFCSYKINMSWMFLEDQLEKYKESFGLDLDPPFQRISRSQVGCMMRLYRLHIEKNDWERYFHMADEIKVSVKVGGNWARLRYWGLIEEKAKQADDGKDTLRSGYWRLTTKGKAFLQAVTVIPKYITLFNADFKGFKDENDTINVRDVFAKKKDFSYSEVMNWNLDMWDKHIDDL